MFGIVSKAGRAASVVGAIATALLLCQCDWGRDTPKPAEPVVTPTEPVAVTPAIVTPAAMTRTDLLAAMSLAGSAYAGGEALQGVDPLVGRSFAIRIPFGCSGPSPAPDPATAGAAPGGIANWSWGPDRKTIRLTLSPGDWLNTALISTAGADQGWEAVEGFWIPRPWLGAAECPTIKADPLQSGQPAPSPQTVGLAAVFDADGSRLGRRNGRPYEFTVRGEGENAAAAPTAGYRLILEGRLVAFPNGRAVQCRASSPDQRPVCIAAATLDRVAFADGASDTVLSEWRPG